MMDILGLLRELSNSGVSDIVLLVVIPLLVRYWIGEAKSELRDDIDARIQDNNKHIFARFDAQDAKFEARFDAQDARFDAQDAKFNARFDAQDARFDAQDARFDAQDARFDRIDSRFDRIDSRFEKVDSRFDKVDARFDAQDARIDQLDRKNEQRAYDITGHLIDVRERLANIEGEWDLSGRASV